MSGFRLGVRDGRAVLIDNGQSIDVATRSAGRFDEDIMALYRAWDTFAPWAGEQRASSSDPWVRDEDLGLCVPRPRNVFAIGVNYRDHIAEAHMEIPQRPMVFAKFPACLADGNAPIPLTSNRVDWEAELVAVVGRGGKNIAAKNWHGVIAGVTVGQDISDRRCQFGDKPPQFSMGKSAEAFGPIGPSVVSLGTLPDPLDLAISCSINGEVMQASRTSQMIFDLGALVAFISQWVPLEPGDLIFTGTPGGTGGLRDPRRYLAPGDELTTAIEHIGAIRNQCH